MNYLACYFLLLMRSPVRGVRQHTIPSDLEEKVASVVLESK